MCSTGCAEPWDIIADQAATEVVLRFAPTVAARVMEATLAPEQELDELEDGSLEWRAVVSGTVEIKLWILSWGADVEVLAPAALRAEVAGTLRTARCPVRGADRSGMRTEVGNGPGTFG